MSLAIVGRAVEQLGRQIERRAGRPGAGPLLRISPAPKSISTMRPLSVAHDVVRLDIAVHEPGFVHRGDRAA